MKNKNFKGVEFDSFKNEADLLNIALYGISAKQWQENNPEQRVVRLNEIAIEQLKLLLKYDKKFKELK